MTPSSIVSKKGKKISYTMVVEYSAHSSVSFEDYIKSKLEKFKNRAKKELLLGSYPFISYEISDPSIYTPIGGFQGYVVFLKRPHPSVKGFNIEAPIVSMFDQKTKQPYYRPIPGYDRYDGDIYYTFLLDCCGGIFEQAGPVFEDFIRGMLFD